MEISYSEGPPQDLNSLLALYENAGWKAYTRAPDQLHRAVQQSQFVLKAVADNQLVGLVRTVGDGVTIAYIQDILVHTDFQRRGIGKSLMEQTLDRFKHCRQKVLLTDDNPMTRGFYEALGFAPCDQGSLVAFVRMGK